MKPDPLFYSAPMDNGIVLASASPRRNQLLAEVGITFTVVPSDAPEELLRRRPLSSTSRA